MNKVKDRNYSIECLTIGIDVHRLRYMFHFKEKKEAIG